MTKTTTAPVSQRIISEAVAGYVVCNIGQVNTATVRALDKMTRSGTLLKWRGKWFPVAGASYGLGPNKTCWGLASKYTAKESN